MPTDPTLDRAKLRREAEAAVNVDWAVTDEGERVFVECGDPHAAPICECEGGYRAANATHIANLDPPTTLAILDELDRAETALREIDTAASAVCDAIEQGKCDLAELVPGRIREVARAALKEAEDG